MNDYFYLKRGKLGPITAKKELELRPLTVFIGQQGAGKSLFSQLIYFFRNLNYLVTYQDAQTVGETISDDLIVRNVIDNLRSKQRAFAVFADKTASVEWQGENLNLGLGLNNNNREINLRKSLRQQVEAIRHGEIVPNLLGNALFIPAERIIYSHSRPAIWKILPIPSTLTIFADVMDEVGNTFSNWKNGISDTNEGKYIRNLGQKALGGVVKRAGERWKWDFGGKDLLEIDMASSGQKANWQLIVLAQALFEWRQKGLIANPYYIHVEEPEIHLHPYAQWLMVKVLAYLVNQGFRVLLTTHSQTVLYALNNLVSAYALLPNDLTDTVVPEPEVRLSPDQVAAYFFHDGDVENIYKEDQTAPWIEEDTLRNIDQTLNDEMNRIRSYDEFWAKNK